ncbi:hypothetical protein CDAR_543321 [Caerostris darwini]|uniref:Uncharacterized protein n=1 Tax=Caerostris darwini TaxID=1538125 RepID=A0AAV4Q7B5_9ARAC|nr:hypothetical protein CDAR_543321 [Caerostris darwini]
MQDGTPLHVAKTLKQLLKRHFGNDRIISLHFPTTCPSRSPDINLCDFWLVLKLKARITLHINNLQRDPRDTPVCWGTYWNGGKWRTEVCKVWCKSRDN